MLQLRPGTAKEIKFSIFLKCILMQMGLVGILFYTLPLKSPHDLESQMIPQSEVLRAMPLFVISVVTITFPSSSS